MSIASEHKKVSKPKFSMAGREKLREHFFQKSAAAFALIMEQIYRTPARHRNRQGGGAGRFGNGPRFPAGYNPDAWRLDKINAFRQERGLPPVTSEQLLSMLSPHPLSRQC